MLSIRLQRIGRKGYPVYRLVVQEAQRHPLSGRVVAFVGSYNPHTKEANIKTEGLQKYLDNGAHPTPRVIKLIKNTDIKLPEWVKEVPQKAKAIRHAEKLRKNQPKNEAPKHEAGPKVSQETPQAPETAETTE
jgi:small subunit ribosomal protein S16